MSLQATRSTIQLRFDDRENTVVVTPDDQDRFALSVEDAIAACRAYSQKKEFVRQHKILMNTLTEWLTSRTGDAKDAYLTTRDGGLLFLVVMRSQSLNEKIQDSLTDLDIKIANDPALNLIRLSVLAVPAASDDNISSFIS